MPKLERFKKKNKYLIEVCLIILGNISGIIISGLTLTYAASMQSASIYYDNTTSGGSSNTVSGALDELYATASDMEILKESIKSELLDETYSVGSIYMSTEDDTVEKVAEKFGGTWERLENRFLIGAGDKYKVNATGGSTTNTHYHYTLTSYDGTSVYVTTTSKAPASRVVTSSSGVSLSSNLVSKGTLRQDATYNSTISILNPYTAVYMYKRTA